MDAISKHTAKAIVLNIIKDGAKESFVAVTPGQRTEMVMAYLQDQIKKTEQMQTMYMTNPEFKSLFRQTVLALCKGKQQ